MDSLTDLISLATLPIGDQGNKDDKQKQYYQQTRRYITNKPKVSEENKDSNLTDNDLKNERRSGQDRRSASRDRLKRFEYRFIKDRRRNKNIFVKV